MNVDPHYHIWILEQNQGRWAYVVSRATFPTSAKAHQSRSSGEYREYIVTPCNGRSPACPQQS